MVHALCEWLTEAHGGLAIDAARAEGDSLCCQSSDRPRY